MRPQCYGQVVIHGGQKHTRSDIWDIVFVWHKHKTDDWKLVNLTNRIQHVQGWPKTCWCILIFEKGWEGGGGEKGEGSRSCISVIHRGPGEMVLLFKALVVFAAMVSADYKVWCRVQYWWNWTGSFKSYNYAELSMRGCVYLLEYLSLIFCLLNIYRKDFWERLREYQKYNIK